MLGAWRDGLKTSPSPRRSATHARQRSSTQPQLRKRKEKKPDASASANANKQLKRSIQCPRRTAPAASIAGPLSAPTRTPSAFSPYSFIASLDHPPPLLQHPLFQSIPNLSTPLRISHFCPRPLPFPRASVTRQPHTRSFQKTAGRHMPSI